MDHGDDIWNRAALEDGGRSPGAGDRALAAALHLHTMAMSSGVLDAVAQMTDPELDAAEAGYRWLHVPVAADVVRRVRRELAAGALSDPHRASALELSADDAYAEAVENDAALEAAFRSRLRTDPGAFAPV